MFRLRRANKLFAVFTSMLMLAQSFLPIFPLITPQVFAQEVTPTETQTPTPEPTTEQSSPTPTEEIQPTPTEEVTPAPTTEATPSVTPEPTPTVVPTETVTPTPGEQNQAPQQSSNEPPKETGPPEQGQILDGAATEATPSPTVTPEQPEEGVLHASVLQNVEAASLDLDNVDPSNSATLSTDKADYAPTDTAVITGTDFTPGETYNLTVSSDDPPPTSTTVQVTADENGVFVYAYQLDGTYRPNYKVEAKELDGNSVDVVTFTDSDTTYKSPTAEGGNHNEWSNGDRAYSSNDSYATVSSETDDQSYENFNFPSIPAGSTINGIEVKVEVKSSDTSGCRLETRLWSDSDNTHSNRKYQTLSGTDTIYTLGASNDLWGATWTNTDFTNANFHAEVRFDDVSSSGGGTCNSSTVSLDHIQIKLHYTEGGSSSGVQTAVGQCVQDAYGANVQCTANDVSIANVTNIEILDDGCTSPTDTVTFKATWNVQSTATERYNIGLYFASQGQTSALTGTCAVSTLANSPVPPNYNFDGNACGDISSAGSVNPEITMTVQCKDPDGDNTLNLPYCTSWNQNVGENLSCSEPANAIPGSPSKCNCQDGFEVPVTVPHFADIEVVKDLIPANDAGTFNLTVDGTTEASCVGDAGTTGKVSVAAGTNQNPGGSHTVGESMCNGTSASNYTTSISCVDRGQTTFNGGAALTASGAGPLTVPVSKDDDVLCTVTNTRINNASLTIIKDAQPNDAQNFSFTTTGSGLSSFTLDDDADNTLSDTKVFTNLTEGTYAVAETAVTGWSLASAVCSDGSTVDAINLSNGENVTCTFTNTRDTGSVKVHKLADTNGDNTYETTNPQTFTWSLDGSGTNTMGSTVSGIPTGTHTINENTVTDFHLVGWFPGNPNSTQYSCTNLPQGSTYQTLPASVEVLKDQTTEITICNALDTGSITVRKMVDRDGNGTYDETNPADFTWTLDGVGPYAMGFSNTAVPVGSHNINENSPDEYHLVGWFPTGQQGWSCTNLPADTQNTNFHQLPIPVNVGSGGTSDYTICNARDTGSVTIVKEVVGGTALPADWDFSISSVAGTFKSGNSVTLPTGNYTVTESGPTDYSATAVTGICSGLQGGTATMTVTENGGTCTFTNTRDTGSLKVNKRTDGNGDGDFGDSGEGVNGSDSNGFTWSLDGSGTNAIGSTVAGVTTGNHNVGENTVADYHFVGWFTTSSTQYNCTNPEGTTLPVSVAVAKNATSEITLCNARDSGTITIIKDAQPNSGTDFSFETDFLNVSGSDFKLDDDANNTLPNSRSYNVLSGAHSVEEINIPSEWKLTSIICDDQNSTGDLDDHEATINVSNGEAVTCTFVNQKLGKLIIRKETSPNNSNKEFDFTRSFGSGFDLEDGDTRTFDSLTPGDYTVTEVGEPGWVLSSVVCSDQTQANGNAVTVSLDYNETVTCTFNNTKLGKIQGYKFNDTNGDGNRDTGEEYLNGWTIFIDANDNGLYDDGELTQTTSGQFWSLGWHDEGEYEFKNLLPGTYSVCEVLQDDWTNSTPLCQSTTLTAGDTDEVHFGNHEPLTLRAYKIVCENESDLPNWGDNDAPNITATTAQNFVDNSEGACRFEEGWDFQWGYDGQVVKYGNGDQLGAAAAPWQTLGTTNASGYTEAAITSIAEDDDLWVREVLRSNYVPFSYPPAAPTEDAYSAEIYCHRDGRNYDNFDRVDDVRFGETYYCVAFNALNTGEIIVTKYNDDNGNGTRDQGEETLSGWDMNVQSMGDDTYDTTQTTGQDGTTTFEDVTVGDYELTETLKDGWRQTELSCSDSLREERFADDSADDVNEKEDGTFTLNGGQTVYCTVGNQFINPDLTITKSNDTAGSDRSPGGSVTFTITVTATDSAVLGVTVKDLPAGGFTYRPGSWTAVSNARGDLKSLLVTTEPTYASPGTWNLGDMQEGEVVTLTYIADISNDEQPGLYRDLAWAQGTDLLTNQVIANDTDSPQYFVGTEVNVVKNNQSGASVNVKQEVLGAVLGASTELPATGANSMWLMIAAIFMSLGSITALAGWVLRRKYA